MPALGVPTESDQRAAATSSNQVISMTTSERARAVAKLISDEGGIQVAHEMWRSLGLRPRRRDRTGVSRDRTVHDRVGRLVTLYLNPPVDTVVLSVDEHRLERALVIDQEARSVPTLFVALNPVDGQVIAHCMDGQRHSEVLRFLDYLDAHISSPQNVRLVLDNLPAHKHSAVELWFACHPRFTRCYSVPRMTWCNPVELVFALFERRTRWRIYRSVAELHAAVDEFIAAVNRHPRPFCVIAGAALRASRE